MNLVHQLMRRDPLHLANETDAARIVFVAGVIQSLGGRIKLHRKFPGKSVPDDRESRTIAISKVNNNFFGNPLHNRSQ